MLHRHVQWQHLNRKHVQQASPIFNLEAKCPFRGFERFHHSIEEDFADNLNVLGHAPEMGDRADNQSGNSVSDSSKCIYGSNGYTSKCGIIFTFVSCPVGKT